MRDGVCTKRVCSAIFAFSIGASFLLGGCPLKPPKKPETVSQPVQEEKAYRPTTSSEVHYRFWEPGGVDIGLSGFLTYLRETNMSSEPSQEERPYFFIILLDDTGVDMMEWDQAIRTADAVIAQMDVGEAAIVIGIDNDSRQGRDVRVPLTVLASQTVKVPRERLTLRQKVRALTQRPVVKEGTDILGALSQALHYAAQTESTHRPVVVGLSNMVPQDEYERLLFRTDASGVAADAASVGKFPEGAEGAFFYVSTEHYSAAVNYWQPLMSQIGVNVEPLP